ncbi:MAG: M50 family metallopeptidase [Pyrinomonadaceae bacterium]|nr:M50 family metallopeptidase [Pyrinomonadaceae bacterium]
MNLQVANDARPQFKFLLAAIFLSVGLWAVAWIFPIANYLVYPLQLFATFVHEGSHVLAAILTGSNVQSLTVSPDTSGVVWSQPNGWFAGLLISSAGYLGTTAFGTALLAWMRFGFSSRLGLYISAGFIGIMTLIFGLIFPIFNAFSLNVTFGSIIFTVISGTLLTGGIFAIAKYADIKWANFALAFLSVQCLLNAFFSLKELFLISATTNAHSDAVNMANATGIPSIVWVLLWIVISIAMISIGLRIYVASQKSTSGESLFND